VANQIWLHLDFADITTMLSVETVYLSFSLPFHIIHTIAGIFV